MQFQLKEPSQGWQGVYKLFWIKSSLQLLGSEWQMAYPNRSSREGIERRVKKHEVSGW